MANDEWRTPQYIFDWLDREFHFDVDVAATAENTKCHIFMKDGLVSPWVSSVFSKPPTCWMNPPYSNPKAWLKKAYEESLQGCTVVSLIPGDTSTEWFHDLVWGKAEVRIIKGRINFINPDKTKKTTAPKFGCILAIYGPNIEPRVITVKRPDKPKLNAA